MLHPTISHSSIIIFSPFSLQTSRAFFPLLPLPSIRVTLARPDGRVFRKPSWTISSECNIRVQQQRGESAGLLQSRANTDIIMHVCLCVRLRSLKRQFLFLEGSCLAVPPQFPRPEPDTCVCVCVCVCVSERDTASSYISADLSSRFAVIHTASIS